MQISFTLEEKRTIISLILINVLLTDVATIGSPIFSVAHHQCWASYSNNVIYYALLVSPFKSNIVTLLITFWQQ